MRDLLRSLRATPLIALIFGACAGGEAGPPGGLTGTVTIDGSSTVQIIAEAFAEEFQIANPRSRVTVSATGTGGGFEQFCAGDTDISDASRRITAEEARQCATNGVEYLEFEIAWDGITVASHRDTDWVECLTLSQLRRIWAAQSTITRWNQVDPSFPDEPLRLYGAGTDSGTFDYFTEVVNGVRRAARTDVQRSESDNELVGGVAGDPGSLGYFGYAYYLRNQDRLTVIAVDAEDGAGCIEPNRRTIRERVYRPLTRPLYVYANRASLDEPAVRGYVEFMLANAAALLPGTGYHALDAEQYQSSLDRLVRETGD